MSKYKPIKGISFIYILAICILANIFVGVLIYLVNTYIILSLLRVALFVMDVYFVYYILLDLTLYYELDSENLMIKYFFGLKKIIIPYSAIEGYDIKNDHIHGVKLSGIGNDRFAFGRSIIDKIGTTHMFVSNSKNSLYVKTAEISYAISPNQCQELEGVLVSKNIKRQIGTFKVDKNIELYKDKLFSILFILITVIILILTLNPLILYLKNMLPAKMPLNFNSSFEPINYGTGKQFAFKQMTYGVMNMIVLLCMYYASYFCAKYDKKTAYRYIYLALITSATFLMLQIRVLMSFHG